MGCLLVIVMLNIGSNVIDEVMSIFKDMGIDILVVQFLFVLQVLMLMLVLFDIELLFCDVVGLEYLVVLGLYLVLVIFYGCISNVSIVGVSVGFVVVVRLWLCEGCFFLCFDDYDIYVVVGVIIVEVLGVFGDLLCFGE